MTDTADVPIGSPPALGSRLRQVRTARGLSVRELARRAGRSASLLSQVERGVTVPSAAVVYALANELGISLDLLFGGDEIVTAHLPPLAPTDRALVATEVVGAAPTVPWGRITGPEGDGIVQRASARSTIDLSTGVRWERLTPSHDRRVDFLDVVYEPGGQSCQTGQAVRHDGREYLRVLSGELEAVIGFDSIRLSKGDSLAFDPTTPHRYRNPTSHTVRAVSFVVHDPNR